MFYKSVSEFLSSPLNRIYCDPHDRLMSTDHEENFLFHKRIAVRSKFFVITQHAGVSNRVFVFNFRCCFALQSASASLSTLDFYRIRMTYPYLFTSSHNPHKFHIKISRCYRARYRNFGRVINIFFRLSKICRVF